MSKPFKPTRLAIKRHTVTGLRYFCKSEKPDFERYKGSGKEWKPHIKEHGRRFVVNDWVSDWFSDRAEIKSFALSFSEIFNIVESPEWANEMPENGIFGGSIPKASNHFTNNPYWEGKKRDPRTEEHRDGIIAATLLNNNGVWPTYERTEQHNLDMGVAVKAAKALQANIVKLCPKCGTEVRGSNAASIMKQWHGEGVDCVARAIAKANKPVPKPRGPRKIKPAAKERFTVGGIGTTPEGDTKTWAGTDKKRRDRLRWQGWSDITIITLPQPMSGVQAHSYLREHFSLSDSKHTP